MNMYLSNLKLVFGLLGLMLATTVKAGQPVWTMTPVPGFPPAVTVSQVGTATIQYTVTNQSKKTHSLQMQPIQGITSSGCTSPLGGNQSCTLNLTVSGSGLKGNVAGGPVLCERNSTLQCYQPAPANQLAIQLSQVTSTLTASLSTLALSINCQPSSGCTTTQNAALTGNPRQITIQNTGTNDATGLSVNSTGLPSGTSISGTTCSGTLAAGASCTITLTPGAIATRNASNTACTSGTPPVAGAVTVTANGGASATVNIYVLGYGCQYQGGFLYAVDDTTPNTGSIGGKVLSLVDQAAPSISTGPQSTSLIWSSNGNGGASVDVAYDAIYGISQISTPLNPDPSTGQVPGQTGCDGANDGACDTNNIFVFYETAASAAPINRNYYATGLCKQPIAGYSDWFLPATCEMDAVNVFIICAAGIQDIFSTLPFLIGDSSAPTPATSCSPPASTMCLAGNYWASSQADSTTTIAWEELFTTGSSSQNPAGKENRLGVRCARALT